MRNFEALYYMLALKSGDIFLFFQSGDDMSAVGVARVNRGSYADD